MRCGDKDGITVEVAMTVERSFSETVKVFTNNFRKRDGGTHLPGCARR